MVSEESCRELGKRFLRLGRVTEGLAISFRGFTNLVVRPCMVPNGWLFTQQSCSRFKREVIPGPFRHHAYTVSETNQEEDVDDTPMRPSHAARCVERSELSCSLAPPDRDQPTTAVVGKW